MSANTTSTDTHQLAVDSIAVVERHRADLGDVDALAASMAAEGLLHPVVVTSLGRLVAGERRLAAARLLGWTTVPVTVVGDVEDAAGLLRMERDENECRKEMTPSEKVSLGRALEELERPKARERQAHGETAPGRNASVRPNESDRRDAFDVREVVAPAVGMSTASYSRAKQIVTAAEQGDDDAVAAQAEMDRTGKVTPAYEKWKGQPVNRGAEAPTTRDAFGVNGNAAKQSKPSPVKNFRGSPAVKAIPRSLSTLAGIAHGMSTLTAADLADVPDEVRAAWSKDLSGALSILRAARDLIKETQ
jgi:ParB-like chromosome segregation protein Spo0J